MPIQQHTVATGAAFESIVADAFHEDGWRVRPQPIAGDLRADLVVSKGRRKYVVEVKSTAEGRRDRLVPLLAQAILQAQAFADQFRARADPLAVVAARHVPASVAEHIRRFAKLYAPEVAIGIVDAEGFRSFAGSGLDGLDSAPHKRPRRSRASAQRLPSLYSDLNQWMLKIILGQNLSPDLISVPRGTIRNAAQLARAANVSVMSASRFVKRLTDEGFLDTYGESLQIVRVEELLERWVSEGRGMSRDIPARWIIRQDIQQFLEAVARYAAESEVNSGEIQKPRPRACIGLFAAAELYGLGFVRGALPHLYLEHLDYDVLNELGVSIDKSDRRPDINIRLPSNKESIFRASVLRDNLPIADVLQVWLDTSTHPARGREQADEIRRHALGPMLGEGP